MTSVALDNASRIVKPRTRVPQLSVPTVGGGRWSLEGAAPTENDYPARGEACP